MTFRVLVVLLCAIGLAACASAPAPRPSGESGSARPAGSGQSAPGPTVRRGGYYMDDGPGENPPPDLMAVPDAVPKREVLNPRNMRPYVVFGRQYTPMAELGSSTERGMASWYGRKFHGQRTANGEVYDMYAMTAAHPTAPIPSYARVTHLGNGRSVVVRINDRGPFLNNRIIDLSYTAALRLGYLETGSALVQVDLIGAPEQWAASTPLVAQAASVPPALPTPASGSAAPVTVPPTMAGSAAMPAVETAPPSRLIIDTQIEAGGGHILQLGAFSSRENAQAALNRLARQLEGLGIALSLRVQDGLTRVVAGPWAKREEAAAANERIRATTEIRPVLRTVQ
jgi:rare lipoprotein A